MPFTKIDTSKQMPKRHWSLIAFPEVGKSTFAGQMRGELLVIDPDQRFGDTKVPYNAISGNSADNASPVRIHECLSEGMVNGAGAIGTIVLDSWTALYKNITAYNEMAKLDPQGDQNRDKAGKLANKIKADAMATVLNSVAAWGTDILIIQHYHRAGDQNGQNVSTKPVISETERDRLTGKINMEIELFIEQDGRRGARVVWARNGNSDVTLYDETGCWKGMPERIEEAVYGKIGESKPAEAPTRTSERPASKEKAVAFQSPQEAIKYGLDAGAFDTVEDAENSYNALKTEKKPKNAAEMAALWVEKVKSLIPQMTA